MSAPAQLKKAYDYIVVGAGSAGCIVAARLAESGFSVLLLEAGAEAGQHPETLRADGFKDAFANEDAMWHRMSTPQEQLQGRSLFAGSGRVAGGSGAVNGMVYTRGDRRDFESWPAMWQWQDLQSTFEQIEARLGIQSRPPSAFAQRFLDAAQAAGFKRKDGMNDGDLLSVVGCNAMNFRADQRRSSYRAYLHDQALSHCQLVCDATVQRIEWDSSRAQAVHVRIEGSLHRIEISKELVICAGALETPRLLMLSGVGAKDELATLGIQCVVDSPEVGKNLQDHPNVCLFYRAQHPVDFDYPQVYGFDAVKAAGAEGGASAPNACFVCYAAPASLKQSMLRMLPILALPGRLHASKLLRRFVRGLVHVAFRLPMLRRFVSGVFGIVVILGKPHSRGSIRLRSPHPDVAAEIDLGYFSDARDRALMEAAIERAREIAGQASLSAVGTRPLSTGAHAQPKAKLWKWINQSLMTTFHYAGTCRMGEDAASPVDSQLRLKGADNIRIADASVIPELPVSAINAVSMAIGHRAADFIVQSAKPQQSSAVGAAA